MDGHTHLLAVVVGKKEGEGEGGRQAWLEFEMIRYVTRLNLAKRMLQSIVELNHVCDPATM